MFMKILSCAIHTPSSKWKITVSRAQTALKMSWPQSTFSLKLAHSLNSPRRLSETILRVPTTAWGTPLILLTNMNEIESNLPRVCSLVGTETWSQIILTWVRMVCCDNLKSWDARREIHLESWYNHMPGSDSCPMIFPKGPQSDRTCC